MNILIIRKQFFHREKTQKVRKKKVIPKHIGSNFLAYNFFFSPNIKSTPSKARAYVQNRKSLKKYMNDELNL